MCDCISNIRQNLGVGTEVNGKEIDFVEVVESGNFMNFTTGEELGERIKVHMKIHFKDVKAKPIKQNLPLNYCPFCGQPYREDLYDYHILKPSDGDGAN